LQKNNKYRQKVAYWLVPQWQQRQELQSLVVKLAERFAAPVFVPHLTVHSCRRSIQQHELEIMVNIACRYPAVTVPPEGIASTNSLARTLFIKFPEIAPLRSLFQRFHDLVPNQSVFEWVPHLSLLYQSLPASVRETLVRETSLPLQDILFDELWAVAIPEEIRILKDFKGWQPLVICRLAA
jgi:hypothetical protein